MKLHITFINKVLIGKDHALSIFINHMRYLKMAQKNHQAHTTRQLIILISINKGLC